MLIIMLKSGERKDFDCEWVYLFFFNRSVALIKELLEKASFVIILERR